MRYDVIIIGTGAGGGTLVHSLAHAGKNILVLERGPFLPREKENWDSNAVVTHDRYHTTEVWRDAAGGEIHPGTGYFVGGNTKVYGGALLRFRQQDFEQVLHKGGLSPAWPISYAQLEPYYTQAERLYRVHGQRGIDPTEPWMSADYPHPPVSHEPRIQEIAEAVGKLGLKPAYTPLGIDLDERDRMNSRCIRCATCDGYPCLVDAKSDADVIGVRPVMKQSNVTLITEAKVTRILTSPSGRSVSEVEVERHGEKMRFSSEVVVVACGAINSAALLLASANEQHPQGLANSSGQVGRNFMKHQNGGIVALGKRLNPTAFQKTLMFNDFYWGEEDFPYPMGHVSLTGKMNREKLALGAPRLTPGWPLEKMAEHSVDWWITSEDLPDPENRVRLDGSGGIVLEYRENNTEAYERLVSRWIGVLEAIEPGLQILPTGIYLRKKVPLSGVAHQCGTARFGRDPRTSVLDADCRAHEVDNLYVVDASFFPSSGAVNPSLTIIANALRVGEKIAERLK